MKKSKKSLVSRIILFIFFACPKKTNQKKRQPITWSDCVELPCAPQNDREFENSLRSNRSNSFFGRFFGARLREMAINKLLIKLPIKGL
ncbi:MAG: hypothetical protein AMJ60_11260 [Desulfobacterales bacterium SG8_35]|nr:MAG: hypothetical protein AMJ60_11260 [Desulfobacterales bacterium SG8_35]